MADAPNLIRGSSLHGGQLPPPPSPALPAQEPPSVLHGLCGVYVYHSKIVCALHAALTIACCAFVLPLVSLSNPDAGLRLREDPLADRADGFLASLTLATPPALVSATSFQTADQVFVNERSQPTGNNLTLIWYTTEYGKGNVFTLQALKAMAALEDRIWHSHTYQTQLCLVQVPSSNNNCTPPVSPSRALLAGKGTSLSARLERLYDSSPYFFSADYLAHNRTSGWTQSMFPIGFPLPGYTTAWDRRSEQNELAVRILREEIVPMILQFMGTSPPTGPSASSPQLKLTYGQGSLRAQEAVDVLYHDLMFASLAVGVVLTCLCVHFQSVVVGVGAMAQVLASFPIALFVYRIVFGVRLINGLHVLGVFLILGIGVDDCFVYFDAFDQLARVEEAVIPIPEPQQQQEQEQPERGLCGGRGRSHSLQDMETRRKRIVCAFTQSAYSMFATTTTTLFCFLTICTSGIPAIKYFGMFAALLVGINYVLCLTMFTAILVMWDQHIRRRRQPPGGKRGFTSAGTGTNAGEDETGYTVFERAFVCLAQNVISSPLPRFTILIAFAAVVAILTVYATNLQPSKTLDSFYPVGHPYRVYEELSNAGFSGGTSSTAATAVIKFANGLSQPFRCCYDYVNNADFGKPLLDGEFQAARPQVQEYLAEQCDTIRAAMRTNQSRLGPLAWGWASSSAPLPEPACPMVAFRDWMIARESASAFPVRNTTKFYMLFTQFLLRPQFSPYLQLVRMKPVDGTGLSGLYTPQFYFNQFPTMRSQVGDTNEERRKLWSAFREYRANGSVPGLGADGSTEPVDGFYEVWMGTQMSLQNGATSTIGQSMAIFSVVLVVASYGDWLVTLHALFVLGCTVSCTIGIMFLMGWSLGAVESVSISLLCGIAVDYSIHLCLAFSETNEEDDGGKRVTDALRRMGVPVFYGGLTTVLASCFLMMCTITILQRFGQFMVIVVSVSLCFSIFVLMALLSLVGYVPRRLRRPLSVWQVVHVRLTQWCCCCRRRCRDYGRVVACTCAHAPDSAPQEDVVAEVVVEDRKNPLPPEIDAQTEDDEEEDGNTGKDARNKPEYRRYHCAWTFVVLTLNAVLVTACVAFGVVFQMSGGANAFRKYAQPAGVQLPSLKQVSLGLAGWASDFPENIWTEVVVDNSSAFPFTGCAQPNTPYSFFVFRPSFATTANVFVEFQGRGAGVCFDAVSCSASLAFPTDVDRARFRRINEGTDVNFATPQALAHMYLPYCTADAFLGNRTATYHSDDATDGPGVSVRHLGLGNALVVTRWLRSLIFSGQLLPPPEAKQSNRTQPPRVHVVFQSCGVGSYGAMQMARYLARNNANPSLMMVSLIMDSATFASKPAHKLEMLATTVWSATPTSPIPRYLDLATTKRLLRGRMIVGSSAYDWFQTEFGGFANSTEFRSAVESTPSVFPFLLWVSGDDHCVVLNPVRDRFETNEHVVRAVNALVKGDAWNATGYDFKCRGRDCASGADLRGP